MSATIINGVVMDATEPMAQWKSIKRFRPSKKFSRMGLIRRTAPIHMQIPKHLLSEANIQAELYGACKVAGLNVSLEVSTPVGRLDLAVFSPDWTTVLAIVECKREDSQFTGARQIARYRTIGVPVFKWMKMDCAEILKSLLSIPQTGVLLETILAMPRFERKRRKHRFNPETDLDESLVYRQ